MSANITLIDTEYKGWVADLCRRFRQSQLKASVKVNHEMLLLYWSIGRDIVELKAETRWGDKLLQNLSRDLKRELPESKSFSPTNLLYMKNFYLLYSPLSLVAAPAEERLAIAPQAGEQSIHGKITPQVGEQIVPDAKAKIRTDIFSVPWGHHKVLIDKYKENPKVALFYVAKTVENGWSRSMLLNFIDTDLHKRQGAALTNFSRTLPDVDSDLAREITKDPYNFAFTGITERYNEAQLKAALLSNITKFLIELGSGFAYVGREHRLQIGNTENFIDLLFYNLDLRCYVAVEVKTGKFEFADMGQLTGYVVACNHLLRKEGLDNPTIGLLICKDKDNTMAQYALEGCTQPIGISEFELAKLYPEKVEGTIPTVEEIEAAMSQ